MSKKEEDFDASLYGFDIHASFEIQVEWDILVSASDACLNRYARGFMEKEVINQLPASITYRIWQKQLGELGTLEIRKLRPGLSQIYVSGVSLGSEDTAPVWEKEKLEWNKKIKDAQEGLSKEDGIRAYLAISKEIDKAKKRINARQKNHQAEIINAYFKCLERENIWPDALENLQSASARREIRKTGGRPRNADDDWAYEQIRNLGRDKQTVFNEWLERIGDRRALLSNPQDSFNKAVSLKRGKKK